MKDLNFKEYTAPYEDQDGDEHESTIRAAVIRKEDVYYQDENDNRHTREVVTPTGSRKVQEGDVFVETDRPGVYDYLSAEAWKELSYGKPAAKKSASSESGKDDDSSSDKSDDKKSDDKQPAKKAVSSSGNR